MPSSSNDAGAHTDRREFLSRVVGAGVAVAGTSLLAACANNGAAVAGAAPAPNATASWDMSWRNKLGTYRTAYDSPEVMGGAALAYADAAYYGYGQMGASESEFTPIVILRHRASVMVLDDEMWSRIGIGEENKLKDPTTGETSTRNPFINWKEGDKHGNIGEKSGVDALIKRGAVVLTCNWALTGVAGRLRNKEKDHGWTPETSLAEIRKHVLPGCYVMPNGIFAVSAAQDAGAHYMRVLV